MRLVLLAVLVISGGCKNDKAAPDRAVCHALAIAADTAVSLREGVSAQLASTDRAMGWRAQWESKEITEDGTGKYSSAERRAWQYKQGAFALCVASALVDRQLGQLALGEPHPDSELVRASGELGAVAGHCMLDADPIALEASGRKAALDEWAATAEKVRAAEDAMITTCHRLRGGARKPSSANPVLIMGD